MKWTPPYRGARCEADFGNEAPRWEVRNLINPLQNAKSKSIVFVGIDLAKNVLVIHGTDQAGKPARRKSPRQDVA